MLRMISGNATRAIGVMALCLLAACSQSKLPVPTGKGSIRGINAIADSPELIFRIEETSIGNANFKDAAGFARYDDFGYNFNFDMSVPGQTDTPRLATEFIDVAADTEYTLVLTGSVANPVIMRWEEPSRTFDAGATVFEMDFVHLSPDMGQVDLYFLPDGTAPAAGNEIATLQNGDRVPYQEFDGSTEYVVTLTTPGNPGDVLFQSFPFSGPAAGRGTVALFDTDPSITAPAAVTLISNNGGTSSLADVNSPPQLRLLHASYETGNVDGYYDADFANIKFTDIGFGVLSPYVDFPSAGADLTLTPTGETMPTILENTVVVGSNSRRTVMLSGKSDALSLNVVENTARPISEFPVLRIVNLADNQEAVDVYMLDPGTPIDDNATPRFSFLATRIDTGFFPLQAGQYELTLTVAGEKTVVSAPVTLNLAAGDYVDTVILDTGDPATLELRVVDSNQP